MLASNYKYEEEFNHVIIALLSIMAILYLRAARQKLGTQRNDDVFLFNMSITESPHWGFLKLIISESSSSESIFAW